MNQLRYNTSKFCAAALAMLVVGARSTATAEIVNGDFGTGDFTGWRTEAIDAGLDPTSPDPYISVISLGDGNAANFTTGQFVDGLFLANLAQTFTVNSATPILTFDFTLPTVADDTTGTGMSAFLDALFVTVETETDLHDLLLLDQLGPLVDPFGTAPGDVTLANPLDSDFDYSVVADLSSLAGLRVSLLVDLIQDDDGSRIARAEFSNFRLVVPEPSTIVLCILTGLAAFRTRRGSTLSPHTFAIHIFSKEDYAARPPFLSRQGGLLALREASNSTT